MAAASKLSPRKDKVWKAGMEVWRPAGRIEGLFAAVDAPSPSEETAATPDKANTESVPSLIVEATLCEDSMATVASLPGSKRGILIAVVVSVILLKLAMTALVPMLSETMFSRIEPVAIFLSLLAVCYFSMERLINLGMSRWWILALFAPVINLWIGYRCIVCPTGYADHKKLDDSSKKLTLAYIAIILLAVWAFWP